MPRFNCTRCSRHKQCKGAISPEIHGTGGDLMIVGESPGREEEAEGRPFIGPSGGLLRPLLKSLDNYIICNSCFCYSKGKPSPKQLEACRPYLYRLIKRHKPRFIVALGAYAAKTLLGRPIKVTSEFGASTPLPLPKTGGRFDAPIVIVQYHPAYLLHTEETTSSRIIKEQWMQVWHQIDRLLEGEEVEKPKVHCYNTYQESLCRIEELHMVTRHLDSPMAFDYEVWNDVSALRPELGTSTKVLCIGVTHPNIKEFKNKRPHGESFIFNHPLLGEPPRELKIVWTKILKMQMRKRRTLIAHNAKYEHKINLLSFGFSPKIQDTMIASHHLDETASHSLGAVARRLQIPWAMFKSESHEIQVNPVDAPLEDLLTYCGLDAVTTLTIYEKLAPILKEQKMWPSFQNCNLIARALAQLEITGLQLNSRINQEVLVNKQAELNILISSLVDKPGLEWIQQKRNAIDTAIPPYHLRKRKKKRRTIPEYERLYQIWQWREEEKQKIQFNPSSPVQVKLVCESLSIQGEKTRRTKNPSFGKDTLEKHKANPVIAGILKARVTKTLIGTYLTKWPEYSDDNDRVHTEYQNTFVVTGRLSSRNPNLQNIPRDSDIKKVFCSRYRKGYIINADFSQLEPRILASISGDEDLIRIFKEGEDQHLLVASRIFNLDYEEMKASLAEEDELTIKRRYIGKTINLGTMYGLSAYGLAKLIGSSDRQAQKLLDNYFQSFPGVATFRTEKSLEIMETCQARDIFGRTRHLPEVRSPDEKIVDHALRQGINFIIQSTGNQLTLLSVCAAIDMLKKSGACVVSTVHDSIMVDCPKTELEWAAQQIRKAMLFHNKADHWKNMAVPLEVDLTYGPNLYEQEAF